MIAFSFSQTAVYENSRANIDFQFCLTGMSYCHQFQCELVIPEPFIFVGDSVCVISPRSLRKDKMMSHSIKLIGQQQGAFNFDIRRICFKGIKNQWHYLPDTSLQLFVVEQAKPVVVQVRSVHSRIAIYENLKNSFSRDELVEICFLLGVNHENFSDRHERLAQEIVAHFERAGQLSELRQVICDKRPHLCL